jgi:hypothetical protein
MVYFNSRQIHHSKFKFKEIKINLSDNTPSYPFVAANQSLFGQVCGWMGKSRLVNIDGPTGKIGQ